MGPGLHAIEASPRRSRHRPRGQALWAHGTACPSRAAPPGTLQDGPMPGPTRLCERSACGILSGRSSRQRVTASMAPDGDRCNRDERTNDMDTGDPGVGEARTETAQRARPDRGTRRSAQGCVRLDDAGVDPPEDAWRRGEGGPPPHPEGEPRRVRAGGRPRSDRDPRGPGNRPAPGSRPAPPRSGWRSHRSPTTAARRRSWHSTSPTPRGPDILVQASGDAHLSNFGLFASPERTLVFDANDFDETLPGPWEWDVKRLAASVIIAGRANGFSAATNREATMADGAPAIASGWPLRRDAASSRSSTRRSPPTTSSRAGRSVRTPSGRGRIEPPAGASRRSSRRLVDATACAPSSSLTDDRRRTSGHPR